MNILILDVETTVRNKGNPFDQTNKLVCVGIKWLVLGSNGYKENYKPEVLYSETKYKETFLPYIQTRINQADLVVGFNIKFDLHWLRRSGVDISNIKVWDCQLAEFILNNQKTPYPSLDQAAEKYDFPKKLDVVKNEFWDKGIDTDKIPHEVLTEYLEQDLVLTQQVFEKQKEQFANEAKDKYALFKLQCLDLLVLEEMEYNGVFFNTEAARKKAGEIDAELKDIYQNLSDYIGNIPFNPNSNDHVSALLYGGVIEEDIRVPIGVYKSGIKEGQTRYKIITKQYELPRLVEPLKGSETSKSKKKSEVATSWSVNADVLRQLKLNKKAKKIVDLLNRGTELEKLKNTYLIGWSDLIDKMNWEHNIVHGNLNQCTVITGRLSSTKPNMQNADPTTKVYCSSRYKELEAISPQEGGYKL